MRLSIVTLSFLFPASSSSASHAIHPEPLIPPKAVLVPQTTSGNVNCSAASSNTTFHLTFISYGNWTALPSEDENPIQHLESVSFAVSNAANGVSTICAFALDATLSGNLGILEDMNASVYLSPLAEVPSRSTVIATSDNDATGKTGRDAHSSTGATWQACADRKDTDGKHKFTIATDAVFGLAERSLSVKQTWFCHDDAGRLVAFTGVTNTT